MQKEIIIQSTHKDVINKYKKISFILIFILLTIMLTFPFKKNITIMAFYDDHKFIIETTLPSKNKIIKNNYLYINNQKYKYTVEQVTDNQIILKTNYSSQKSSENEQTKLVLPTDEKPIIKYLYDYIRRT